MRDAPDTILYHLWRPLGVIDVQSNKVDFILILLFHLQQLNSRCWKQLRTRGARHISCNGQNQHPDCSRTADRQWPCRAVISQPRARTLPRSVAKHTLSVVLLLTSYVSGRSSLQTSHQVAYSSTTVGLPLLSAMSMGVAARSKAAQLGPPPASLVNTNNAAPKPTAAPAKMRPLLPGPGPAGSAQMGRLMS